MLRAAAVSLAELTCSRSCNELSALITASGSFTARFEIASRPIRIAIRMTVLTGSPIFLEAARNRSKKSGSSFTARGLERGTRFCFTQPFYADCNQKQEIC